MRDVAAEVLYGLDWAILVYFLVLNTTYLVLLITAWREIVRYVRRRPFARLDEVFANPMTPPVSIIIPAHDEEAGILPSVQAMLGLRYPQFEVIVVDDGSSDRTFEVLTEAFDLVPVPRALEGSFEIRGALLGTYAPRDGSPVVVLRKESVGSKTDALNAGLSAARYPLVCMVDADAFLDEVALLRVVKPFIDDPSRVVASGGVIRPANGSTIHRGRLVEARMPRRWLARIQVVEYLRAFTLGRSGWSRFGGLLIISGAFGLFRKDLLVELGGYDHESIGEDAELVVRLHRHLRDEGRDYRIVFVADPVCWTEVPEEVRVLARQRTRWARGLADLLRSHRTMIGSPRYGRVGVVVMPYYLVFESLGPVVELVGVVSVIVGLVFGLVNVPFAILFFLVAFGYGIFLTWAALAIEELTFRRYARKRDLLVGLAAGVAENIGYRQVHAWWRLRGLVQGIRGKELAWGEMQRKGFLEEVPPEGDPAR